MNMINLLPILTLDKSASEDIRRNATMMALGASNPVIGAVATRSLLDSAVQAEQSNARLRAEVAQLRSAAPREAAADRGTPRDAATGDEAGPAVQEAKVAGLRAEVAAKDAKVAGLVTELAAKDARIAALAAEVAAQQAKTVELTGQVDALTAAAATAPASGQQADTAAAKPVK